MSSLIEKIRHHRALSAFLIFLLLFMVFFFVSGFSEILLPPLYEKWIGSLDEGVHEYYYDTIVELILVIALVLAFCLAHRSSPAAMGLVNLKEGVMPFLRGLFYGAGGVTLITGVLFLKGDVSFSTFSLKPGVFAMLVFFAGVALSEETLTRGVLQHTFVRKGYVKLGLILPSLLFGALHLGNPSATWLSIFNTMLIGLILALGVYLGKNLYSAIGFHLTWNFFLSIVYGLPVSGFDFSKYSMMQAQLKQSDIWNGGEYGIEGGLLTTILFFIVLGVQAFLLTQGKRVKSSLPAEEFAESDAKSNQMGG